MNVSGPALGMCLSAFLAACGSGSDVPAPKSKADVTVTLDEVHHVCNVALSNEAQASSIPCADVASFLRDELRLPSGAVYDLHGAQKADSAELADISAKLKSAGYRSARERSP
jgi:hypothetical protein